jgi:NAD(P)-dependent dehydrogenase (short-subunit alcohol dehydrogenase family)
VLRVFATSLTQRADSQTGDVIDDAHHPDGDCAAENILEGRYVMDITGKTALVTGANRGLGRQLAVQLRDRGARVYAAARDPQAVDLAGVTPLALDITDPASVAAAAQAASGVAILVNNAGSSTRSSLLTGDLAAIRLEMDTHFRSEAQAACP